MDLILLEDVEHYYTLGKIQVHALCGVSCKIRDGKMVALVGPSGSGKTTLINLIGSLDTPSSGKIIVDGINLNNLSSAQKMTYRKKKVSFIFQFFNLFPLLNVFENVEFPLLFNSSDYSKKIVSERVLKAITLVGLEGLEKRRIDELSGGQRQRVAIARAFVTGSPIVLADEPTANLDGKTADKIMQLMVEFNQQFNTTFIFTTHDPRIMQYAHVIIELKDGGIVNIQTNGASE